MRPGEITEEQIETRGIYYCGILSGIPTNAFRGVGMAA